MSAIILFFDHRPKLRGAFILRALLCVCTASLSSGCAIFRPAPFIVSPAILEVAEFRNLRASGPTSESYAAAFSPDETFILSAKVLAKVGRLGPKTLIDVSIISAPPDRLRLVARHPGDRTTLFDLVVEGGRMEILLPTERTLYSGPIENGRSPLGEVLGIEPWDIPEAIRLGGKLGEHDFETSASWGRVDLHFDERARSELGLRKVRVDPETSLPQRAWWKKNGIKLNVRYLEWESFGASDSDSAPHVYPTRLVATRNRPYCRFEIWGLPGIVPYRFPGEPHERAFVLRPPPGTQTLPLNRFEELF